MLSISMKDRPIYKAFCYSSILYIIGVTLWALWMSQLRSFATIPVSGLSIYMIYWLSTNILPKKIDYFDVLPDKDKNIKKKTSKISGRFIFLIYMSALINELMIPYKLNDQLFVFYYCISAILLGFSEAFNDITYSTKVNAISTFFKKNTAKRELILKTLITMSLIVVISKLNISLEKLISNDKALINAMFISGVASFFYVLAMMISNLISAYYIMIFKNKLFKRIIKEEADKRK